MIHYPGFTSLAEKHGYIIVCPMGYNPSAWYGAASFVSRKIGKLSEQDVMNVLGIARKEFNIDPDRIYLLGHSMGGGGALHLGMKHPEVWAALAPIAPAIYSSARDLVKIRHIPIICVQGAKDKLVKASVTRRWIAKMKELQMEHQYIEDPEGGHVIIAFQKMGAEVVVSCPNTLLPDEWQPGSILGQQTGFENLEIARNVDEAVDGADVVMALRIQQERQEAGPSIPTAGVSILEGWRWRTTALC